MQLLWAPGLMMCYTNQPFPENGIYCQKDGLSKNQTILACQMFYSLDLEYTCNFVDLEELDFRFLSKLKSNCYTYHVK